ncbi:hypothetical protein GCK32_020231 [Trichostrongylus colubriformis]|uniref:Uncharacterized protein n=1 Tax=Trichostrongylus colubriformis TaxID=6319 RepID=A0AAN8II64_TRICO
MAWQEHNESVAIIRTIDPEVYLGDSFILLGGPTFALWIYYATALAASSFVIFVVIVKHTSIILRNQARFSEASRKLHQSAMSGLVVQTVAITTTACIPVLMLCISFYIGESLVTSTDGIYLYIYYELFI